MDAATTHVSADTDALASLVALRRLHPGARLVLPGGMEPGAQQLWHDLAPDLPEIESPRSFLERLRREPGGTLHVADTAAPGRLGTLAEQLGLFERVLCWDTHPAEPGDLPRQELPRAAASTSPLVLELHRRGLEPSAVEAGLFLVGIHDDTHHFTVHETSAVDHDAAAICLAWGADPGWPIKYVPRSLTSRQLKLLETISASVELTGHAPGAIAIATLETDEFEPGLATLVGQLRLAEGWAGAFLLAASRGRVDVIARSVPPLDVAAVLSPLGGGGHPGAASATLRGETLHDAKALLAEALESCRGPERTAAELAVARFVRARASDSVRSVADLLHERAVNAVPLFRGRGANLRYVGLVTRREVEGALRHGLAERPAIEISARAPQWIAPETPAAELHRTLTPATGRLAIVGHPPAGALGIVTRTSLLLEAGRQIPLASARKAPSPSSLLAQARRALPEAWPEIEALGDLAIVSDAGRKPGIHVAQFEARGAEAMELAAAVRDDLATAFARQSGIDVITDAEAADYIVAGAIRGAGDRWRISARLTDRANDRTEWSDRFDESGGDPFVIQDRCVTRIAGAVRIRLPSLLADKLAEKPLQSMTAEELLNHAMTCNFTPTVTSWDQADSALQLVLQRDPDNWMAMAMLCWNMLARSLILGWRQMGAADAAVARGLIERAQILKPNSEVVRMAQGALLLYVEREHGAARIEAEESLRLNPDFYHAINLMSQIELFTGDPDKATELALRCVDCDPGYPYLHLYQRGAGYVSAVSGNYADAIDRFQRADRAAAGLPQNLIGLAASAQLSGDIAGAQRAMASLLELAPDFNLAECDPWPFSDLRKWAPFRDALVASGAPHQPPGPKAEERTS